VDTALERLRENSGTVTRGVTEGVVLLGEILTGLIVVALLTFFFLKDGTEIWRWLVGLFAGHHRRGPTSSARGSSRRSRATCAASRSWGSWTPSSSASRCWSSACRSSCR